MRFSWQRVAAVLAVLAGLLAFCLSASAAPPVELAKFTGVASCQSSLCHGGGTGSDQCAIWATVDFHVRAFAILVTPRSKGITDALQEKNPALNERCTVCHAPFQAVPAERIMPGARTDEGVSCESCHGPASDWLRSHTRTDYTYTQRVASGMNDLRSAYGRANTCVACHEYLPPDIARAGHPELIFEMDSQTVSEPPHWHETDSWMGLHAWLAGQAVAYREESWHVLEMAPDSGPRWEALGWLLQQTTAGLKGLPRFTVPQGGLKPSEVADLESGSDRLARSAASFAWTIEDARELLKRLAATGPGLGQLTGNNRQVHRAEVLVQAMDRIVVALNQHGVTIPGTAQGLDMLFADVRAPDGFDVAKFSQDLGQFSKTVGTL